MKKIVDMFNEEWDQQALIAEIESGGIVSGRLGSPEDHPIEEVEEDEDTLRQILRESLKEMLDQERAGCNPVLLQTENVSI